MMDSNVKTVNDFYNYDKFPKIFKQLRKYV